MAQTNDPFGLMDFARNYLDSNGITHHSEIRTENLADHFRQWFGLRESAHLDDLEELCGRLGVVRRSLLSGSGDMLGVNAWYGDSSPYLFMKDDLKVSRAEHTLGHE